MNCKVIMPDKVKEKESTQNLLVSEICVTCISGTSVNWEKLNLIKN